MLYPPKKRAYSPENKKTKELANLMNINSKFTGSGGSTYLAYSDTSSLAPKKCTSLPKAPVSGIFRTDAYRPNYLGIANNPPSSLNITTEEIYPLQSTSTELSGNSPGRWSPSISTTICISCLLYTSPSPRDQRGSRMPSSA